MRRTRLPSRLASLAAISVLFVSCRDGARGEAQVEEWLSTLDMEARVSQLLLVSTRVVAAPDGGLASASPLLRLERDSRPGWVWVEEAEASALAELSAALRAEPGIPILLAADLDEGVGGTIAPASAFPPLFRILRRSGEGEAEDVGEAVGAEAQLLGLSLGVVRSPPVAGGEEVRDLEPHAWADRLGRYLRGAERGDVAIGLHVFWGGEREGARVAWDRARFEALELPLIEASLVAGVDVLYAGKLRVPALTGDTLPFDRSRAGLAGAVRRDLAWEGPILVDARGETPDGLVAALAAGADMVVVDGDAAAMRAAVLAALADGRLPSERLEDAVHRVLRLKAKLTSGGAASGPPRGQLAADLPLPATHALAERTAEHAAVRFEADPEWLTSGRPALLVTPASRGRIFAAAVADYPTILHLSLDEAADSAALVEILRTEIPGVETLVYLDFPAPDGMRLERIVAGLTLEEQPIRIVRIAFRRWMEEEILHDPPAVFAWGLEGASQRAAARLLLDRGLGAASPPVGLGPLLRPGTAEAVGMSTSSLAAADLAIEAALSSGVFSAAGLAVGRRGGLVRLRGYGSASEDGDAVDTQNTLFDLASLTKVVGTTSAVALLVERGELSLDDPVRRIVPEFEGEHKDGVRVRHLLAHTSGLPPGLSLYGSAASPDEALQQVYDVALRQAPGERVEYSDLGMILLAEVVERAAGAPLDQFLARRLFAPLGMASTMFLPPATTPTATVPTALSTERPFPIRGVVHDGNAYRLGGVTGHAGLFSTVRDMAVFAQTMLAGGVYGPVRLLADSTVQSFTQPQPNADTRALGWDTPAERSSAGLYFSSRAFGHTGWTGTSIWIDPEKDLFVVLLTNRTFTEASTQAILRVRQEVHDAVARAITDQPVPRRAGAR